VIRVRIRGVKYRTKYRNPVNQLTGAMIDCCDRIYNNRGSDCRGATLLFWLEIIRHAVATDPRDKIYSVLGLPELFAHSSPSDFDPSFLFPDYTASVQDVYSKAAKAIVSKTNSLNVLLHVGSRTKHITRTWTPDWSTFSENLVSELRAQKPTAAGTSKAYSEFAPNLGTLTVRVFIPGLVSKASTNMTAHLESFIAPTTF
jgi:hypothetical protein